jgi:nucleoside-diphosphate-sugar epimerase
VMHLAADADRTARMTGWRAQVGLEEGLRHTVGWSESEVGRGHNSCGA